MGIDALITAAIIAFLENNRTATEDELVKCASAHVGRRVTKTAVRRAIERNRHRLEVEIDAGVFRISLKF